MLKGVRCIFGNVAMEDHLRCMVERPGPPCGIEPSILQMITRPNMERDQEAVVFSPSSLSSCHRQEALKQGNDWYLDVAQGYKMVRGSIIHAGMGEEPPYPGILGVVREKRMATPINTRYGEQIFKGKPDLVALLEIEKNIENGANILHVKIVDYKTRSEIGHDLLRVDEDYVYQINEYAWLVTQFLPGYLLMGGDEHLQLNEGVFMPTIDEVVVDELSITYMDMVKTRTFTSNALLYTKGKMISDYRNGRWVRRKPAEYDELELEPLHMFLPDYTKSLIRHRIEEQIVARTLLAPPLVGDEASLKCRSCPVRNACYLLGKQQGYDMSDQVAFVDMREL